MAHSAREPGSQQSRWGTVSVQLLLCKHIVLQILGQSYFSIPFPLAELELRLLVLLALKTASLACLVACVAGVHCKGLHDTGRMRREELEFSLSWATTAIDMFKGQATL